MSAKRTLRRARIGSGSAAGTTRGHHGRTEPAAGLESARRRREGIRGFP